jgi:hypothetical protein
VLVQKEKISLMNIINVLDIQTLAIPPTWESATSNFPLAFLGHMSPNAWDWGESA